jgi:hypothetical protein
MNKKHRKSALKNTQGLTLELILQEILMKKEDEKRILSFRFYH